jgi:hypothetical protein
MKEVKMQTNKNNISDQAFDLAKSMNNASRVANLYGKLFAIKDMQIHLLEQEKLIKEELEREDKNE